MLSTPVWIDDDPTASLDIAVEHAEHFRLDDSDARDVVREVGVAVADWRTVAEHHGLPGREIRRMASAFEHEDLDRATGL